MAVLANILWPLALAAFMSAVVAGVGGRKQECRLLVVSGLALIAVESVLQRQWFAAAWNTVFAVILLGSDWWNKRGRKIAKLVGAKSRAVLAKVVERAREAGAPVPQGVRA